ncbi:MAG: hypothetical protein QMD50_02435 [Patescibacteria group bacterium]|nr:hypothetical protein [Patescibacteria group bacterium]
MKKYFLITAFIVIIFFSSLPIIANAAQAQLGGRGIWAGTSCSVCSNNTNCTGGPNKPCSFCDALVVTKNIIDFLLKVAIPLSVALVVYGAVIMMIASGSEEKVRRSRTIITRAFVGVAIALSAWLIVSTLLHILTGNPNLPWATITC